MLRLNVYLDGAPEGPWMGHALDEIGCIWLAPSQGEAISAAPGAIAAFYRWLRQHGEPGVGPVAAKDLKAEIREVQEVPGFGKSGSAVGFFKPDSRPVTDEDLAAAVRRLGYARLDLLGLVAGLPPEALDWEPPGGKRTVRGNLIHVAQCHAFYLSRLLGYERVAELMPRPWPEDTLTCLGWAMERAVGVLLELPKELRSGTFRSEQPAENWTARKMLRRFVEHELEHVEVVRRAVTAWKRRTSG